MPPFYEAGYYLGRILKQSKSKSSGGHPQLVLTVQIEGVYCGLELAEVRNGYERDVKIVVTDKTLLAWVPEQLAALGLPDGTDVFRLDQKHPLFIALKGRSFSLQCKREKWEGREYEKWSFISYLEIRRRGENPVERLAFFRQGLEEGAARDDEPRTV